MRIVLIALMTAALTMPAFAQRMGLGQHKQPMVPKEIAEDQKKRKEAQEKAYKGALQQIPDQKPADPWGKMR